MKTSEFKRELAKLGLTYEEPDTIFNENRYSVAYIDKYNRFEMDTNIGNFHCLPYAVKQKLWPLIAEYAETPVEDREDEKQFRVHVLPYDDGYINQHSDGTLFLDNPKDDYYCKTIFTESEWNKVKGYLPAYDKDNPMFEEVTEDD